MQARSINAHRSRTPEPTFSRRTFLATKYCEKGPAYKMLGDESSKQRKSKARLHASHPLNNEEVHNRRKVSGLNEIKSSKGPAWFTILWRAFVHPFNVLLLLLATTSGALEEFETMGFMIFMSLASAFLRFFQELRYNRTALNLQSLLTKKVHVLRMVPDNIGAGPGVVKEEVIPTEELVPGDWVLLNPGDSVPADVEIIESKDLHVSQAFLTGEAIPVEKFARGEGNDTLFFKRLSTCTITSINEQGQSDVDNLTRNVDQSTVQLIEADVAVHRPRRCLGVRRFFRNLFGLRVGLETDPLKASSRTELDQPNFCYMGTSVVTGTGKAVVESTGASTYFGKMAKELEKRRPVNAFQLGVRRISWIFFLTMICLVPPVLILQGYLNQDWMDAFLFSLSVAVGLTPEMLPMIVNTTLAKGALEMSRKKCIVKNLDAIINLGGIDVLCTDKTGTLTKSVVILTKHINRTGMTSRLPLLMAYLNSHFQSAVSNPLDDAVNTFCEQDVDLVSGTKEMIEKYDVIFGDASATRLTDVAFNFRLINEVPFDFERRRVSVLISRIDSETSENLLICKGAVEETISICSKIFLDQHKGQTSKSFNAEEMEIPDEKDELLVVPLTPKVVLQLKETSEDLNNQGLRVIAVAYKTLPASQETIDKSAEKDLIFAGFLAFIDPPKESTKDAIEKMRNHNLKIKVLTGDSPSVCKKICEEIGLPVHRIVRSKDLIGATDEEISKMANEGTIFAKLTPLQKADIIRALKRNGNIVGFLGDGINDAPALTEADVGISVDTGTDIAKDSADIILLEKNIGVIADGVVIGRNTYGNTLKYIVMAVSSNFGNVFSVLVASCWLPFLPMLPIQLLCQNLLYDMSQISIPWDNMDAEFLEVPHRWSMKSVIRFMVMMGPWSSVFDITTFIYMYFYFNIKTDKDDTKLFQTTWFTVGLLTQTMIVHMIRTPKIPFIQSRASVQLIATTLLIISIGLVLPYVPVVSGWIHLVWLKPMVYPYVFGAIFAYCIVAQLAKMIYIKLFHEWY